MPRIDDEDIRRVREATDLVSLVSNRVVLKQKGRLFWGCCPFHGEKTPSFKIDPDTQLWHCFGCGKGGDVFGYVMESENMEFPEAVAELADRAHIELHMTGGSGVPRSKRDRMMAACKEAESFYHLQLMRSKQRGAADARDYLHGRGFGSGPSKGWALGYAPGHSSLVRHLSEKGFTRDEMLGANLAVDRNGRLADRFYERVMFPVHDLQGRTIAFGGRVIGKGEPKYLNTSETPIFHKSSNLFGIEKAKEAIVSGGRAIVVEGYTDVIALHEAGINCAVATLGTALTAQHVKLLSRFATTIVYLFDGDAAGQKAADRASEFIDWQSAVESRRDPIDLRVVVLPGGKDPAEYVAEAGAAGMQEVLDKSQPLLQFSIERCLGKFDLRKPEQKARALEQSLQILYPIRNSVTASDYVNLIADRLNVEYTSVAKALGEVKAPVAARHEEERAVSEAPVHPRSNATAQIFAGDARSSQMERKLLSLVVVNARLLEDVGKDLMLVQWADPDCEVMADALAGVAHDATPAQALMTVQAACPQAPSLLAEVIPDDEEEADALAQARVLIKSLRVRDLEREIRQAKARMREDSGTDAAELDALFERTVSKQRELVRLRNEVSGS